MLYAVRRVAERSPQHCFTQSAALLYAVRKIAKRSPQDCFTQSAGLLSAVEVTLHFNFLDLHFLPDPSTGSGILGCRRVAEPSRSNTAFQLPRFTFSTGPFDRLRDPRLPKGCFTQSAALLYTVCRVAERSRSNTAFQLPRFTFSTGPFDRLRDPRLLQHCFTQSLQSL